MECFKGAMNMSRTYSIACRDCKESLWIGQGYGYEYPKAYIYTDEPNTMKALSKFLFVHHGHNLFFEDDEDLFGGEGTHYHDDEYLKHNDEDKQKGP